MKLSTHFETGRFVVSGEVGPPKGTSAEEILEGARVMAPVVDVVNVTDNQSAVMRLGSLAVSRLLKEERRPVIILADESSHSGVLVDVIDECKLAGAEQVSIAAERE